MGRETHFWLSLKSFNSFLKNKTTTLQKNFGEKFNVKNFDEKADYVRANSMSGMGWGKG